MSTLTREQAQAEYERKIIAEATAAYGPPINTRRGLTWVLPDKSIIRVNELLGLEEHGCC